MSESRERFIKHFRSIEEFWKSLTPEQKAKLIPHIEAERAAMTKELARTKLYYRNARWLEEKKVPANRRTLV